MLYSFLTLGGSIVQVVSQGGFCFLHVKTGVWHREMCSSTVHPEIMVEMELEQLFLRQRPAPWLLSG